MQNRRDLSITVKIFSDVKIPTHGNFLADFYQHATAPINGR